MNQPPLPAILISRLLDDAMDAVIIIDEQCRIRYLNQAMQSLTGYGAAELLGQPLEGLLPDALAEQHSGHILRYLQSSRPSSVLGQIRAFALRHRSAVMIPIEMKALDLGVIGGTRYFGAFMIDVRERRAIEEKNASLLALLEQQALSDTLTGLPNRRAYEAAATQALLRMRRHPSELAVGVADVDHFKKINDQYGHAAGDAVLRTVAQTMRDCCRGGDIAARLGGEEFGLLLPETTLAQALQVAERIRAAVAGATTAGPDGAVLRVTISIGVAPLLHGGGIDGALSDADRALYRAKHQGRNQVQA